MNYSGKARTRSIQVTEENKNAVLDFMSDNITDECDYRFVDDGFMIYWQKGRIMTTFVPFGNYIVAENKSEFFQLTQEEVNKVLEALKMNLGMLTKEIEEGIE